MAFIVNTKYKEILTQFLRPTQENSAIPALSLFFQKQVHMKSEKVLGYEALLRWFDPHLGYVSPLRCLEMADFYKLTDDLNRWIVMQAVDALKKLPSHHYVAINVCAQSLTRTFAQDILDIFLKAKCDPSRLHIEITEHKAPHSFKDLANTVVWLRRQGIKVILDDFGTGHATMSYLAHVDLDMIKIDKSYIRDIDSDQAKQIVLENILMLIDVANADVLAEGVETREEADVLRRMGINLAQGYLYGKPTGLGHIISDDSTGKGNMSDTLINAESSNVLHLSNHSRLFFH